jgi:hypothetical protein
MPGYGPNDVSLHKMGQKSDGQLRHVGISIEQYQTKGTENTQGGGPPSDDAKSEMFITQGTKESPTWSTRDLRPTNASVDELPDLESHGRDYQYRKGWGLQ